MKIKTLLASMALAGLVAAQPASAATRSVESMGSAERSASIEAEAEGLGGSPLLLIALVFLAVGGLVLLMSDGEDPTSP